MLINQALQIDLREGQVLHCAGYEAGLMQEGTSVRAAARLAIEERLFFIQGSFFRTSSAGLERWLSEYDAHTVADWVSRVDGDFNVAVWNSRCGVVDVITDRTGGRRLHVHCNGRIVTISKTLYQQARLQLSPRIDSESVLTLLTLCYNLDPWSLLKDTYVIQAGDIARCSSSGCDVRKYYSPIPEAPSYFTSIGECVEAIDAAMKETLRRRLDGAHVPLVMLSGGIDSIVMLRYLSEVAPAEVHSLTFSVEGSLKNEMEEGRIASRYYGSRHHQLVIPRSRLAELTRRAIVEGDGLGYGGYLGVAMHDWLTASDTAYDVFRGEDCRIHTPPIDGPTKLGLWLNRSSLARTKAFQSVWAIRELLRGAPHPLLRKYFNYVTARTSLEPSLSEYLARQLCRYHVPDDRRFPMSPALRAEFDRCAEGADDNERFRRFVALTLRLQHTDDVHRAEAASMTSRSRLAVPFFHPEVLQQLARVSVSMGTRAMLVGPAKTRSPFPFADKYVLRKLMASNAPAELLYRHKSTAPAMDVQFAEAARDSILPVLQAWGASMEETLTEPARSLARHYRMQALRRGVGAGDDWATGWAAGSLVFLVVLHQLSQRPSLDIAEGLAELSGMAPQATALRSVS